MQPADSRVRRAMESLRRQAWLVFLVPGLTSLATFAVHESRPPVYRASTTLVVGVRDAPGVPPQLAPSGVTRTARRLLESELIAREVIRAQRLDMSVESFLAGLRVEIVPGTAALRVAYDSTEPRRAMGVTAEVNRIFRRQVANMLGPGSPGSAAATGFGLVVRVFEPPHVEPEPVARSVTTSLVFAALAGLVLGLFLAVGREALDSRIRGRRDAEDSFGAPVLGAIPKGLTRRPAPGVASDGKPDDRAAALDRLRARLQSSRRGDGADGTTVLVTSAGPRTGKAAVAANLAAALARAGERVVCVDADLRRPALHAYLGTAAEMPGLADVLESIVALDAALIGVELAPPSTNGAASGHPRGRLEILQAGTVRSTLDLLTLDTVDRLLSVLRERADYVVLNAPTLHVSDVFPLTVKSDDVLLVARRGRTTKCEAESARRTLDGLGAENVGVVLTDARPQDGSA